MSTPSPFTLWVKHNRFKMLNGLFLSSVVITAYRINKTLVQAEAVEDSIEELDQSLDELQLIEQRKHKQIKEQVHAVFAQPITYSIDQSDHISQPNSSWTRYLWPVNWFQSNPSKSQQIDHPSKLSICGLPIKLTALHSLTQASQSVDAEFIADVISDCDELLHTGTSEKWREIQKIINQSKADDPNVLSVKVLHAYQSAGDAVGNKESGRKIMV